MKLSVVGCSGTFPGPESPCSSYLFEHEGFRLLVDAGNGSLGSLQRLCGVLDIDAVAISHLHGDHFLDLITYTYARRYHPSGFAGQLPVFGPADAADHMAAVFGRGSTTGSLIDEVYRFETFKDGGQCDIGPFSVETLRVVHPVETFAMRITADGHAISYSADSAACDPLIDIARGSELFVCEASYLDGETNAPGIHLTGREAGEMATAADVGKLLVTHLVPWGDPERTLGEVGASWTGPFARAHVGDVFEF